MYVTAKMYCNAQHVSRKGILHLTTQLHYYKQEIVIMTVRMTSCCVCYEGISSGIMQCTERLFQINVKSCRVEPC